MITILEMALDLDGYIYDYLSWRYCWFCFWLLMDDDMIKDGEKKPMESHGSLLVSRSPYFEFLSSGKRQEQCFLQAIDAIFLSFNNSQFFTFSRLGHLHISPLECFQPPVDRSQCVIWSRQDRTPNMSSPHKYPPHQLQVSEKRYWNLNFVKNLQWIYLD